MSYRGHSHCTIFLSDVCILATSLHHQMQNDWTLNKVWIIGGCHDIYYHLSPKSIYSHTAVCSSVLAHIIYMSSAVLFIFKNLFKMMMLMMFQFIQLFVNGWVTIMSLYVLGFALVKPSGTHNGHPSIWWPSSPCLTLAFKSEYSQQSCSAPLTL